ncbi:MAG: glycoside hydrolase family 13 protein [Butyrivibrio sp.]|nr:glycoside hydrolase family 13 protein [Butyrivibrio sp.]
MNQAAFYHDMTLDYIRPAEPDIDRITDFRFRCAADEVAGLELVWGNDRKKMKLSESDGGFDYYDVSVNVGRDPFCYYFEITGKDGSFCRYDRRGPVQEIMDSMKFCVIPGFSSPSWAKGAVMYQIFVDRFCNGDESNDVLSGEYFYSGTFCKKADRWEQYPDPKQDYAEFYGGDLQGVINKLDYLKDLGIDAIYLNPIFVSPSSHKYDTQDYDHIDPHFGKIVEDGGDVLPQFEHDNRKATKYITRVTNRKNLEASDMLFAKLVEEAHKRDIKVILDGVFNHCGSFNKWLDRERIYEEAKDYEKGAFVAGDSPYRNYFSFNREGWPYNPSYDGWWGYDTLPKLNYEGSKELEEYILGVGKKWVSPPYNADGWRLDVAADLGHSREYNHHFWKRFRQEVKSANPNAIILAEHYGSSKEWLMGQEWDTVMNYDAFMEPITWFLTGMDKHSDEFRPIRVGNAREFLETMRYVGGENFTVSSYYTAMNELSNHDHSRFLTRTSQKVGRSDTLMPSSADTGNRKYIMRQAVMMQFTWPGAPTIYYGDEVGVCGFTDPDNRRTYPWGKEDMEMLRFHKEMIRLHKEFPEFLTGSVTELYAENNILVFGRFNRTAASIIAINLNSYEVTRDIQVWQMGIPKEAKLSRLIVTDSTGFSTDAASKSVRNGVLSLTMSRFSGTVLRYDSFGPVTDEEFWSDNEFNFD